MKKYILLFAFSLFGFAFSFAQTHRVPPGYTPPSHSTPNHTHYTQSDRDRLLADSTAMADSMKAAADAAAAHHQGSSRRPRGMQGSAAILKP